MSLRDGDAYAVPAEAVAAFERDGYVHLKGKARLLLRRRAACGRRRAALRCCTPARVLHAPYAERFPIAL